MSRSAASALIFTLFCGCHPAAPSSCCRQPAAVRLPGAQLAQAADGVVKYRDILEFRSPGPEWIVVTNAKIYEFSPPAALLLANDKTKALIRFHLLDSAAATPGEIALQFIGQFETAGYKWRIVGLGEGREGSVSLVWEDPRRPLKGKITVMRLPGRTELTLLLIGAWPPPADEISLRDFDTVAGSAKAQPK